jgi:hypothetical protein
MPIRHTLLSASVAGLGALAFLAPVVRADIPPPEGYVETCTLENHAKPGTECVSCDAWHGEHDKCEKLHGAAGYTQSCRTGGASTWSEVWCRPASGDAAPDAPVPTPAPTAGEAEAPVVAEKKSGKCTGGGLPGAFAWLGAIAALPFLRRR